MARPKVGRNGKPIKIMLPFEEAVQAALEVTPKADTRKRKRRAANKKR